MVSTLVQDSIRFITAFASLLRSVTFFIAHLSLCSTRLRINSWKVPINHIFELFDAEYYRDLEMWVTCHSRSLTNGTFESLGAVSYSPSVVPVAVSVAVCEIFSVKECCDLENRVRVRSRSLEMAPFDRSHTSSYSPSIVTMAIFCIVCEI